MTKENKKMSFNATWSMALKIMRESCNFFKSYVTLSEINRLTFILRKFMHNFPASCCD